MPIIPSTGSVFFEEWDPSYGSPYLTDETTPDDPGYEAAPIVEDTPDGSFSIRPSADTPRLGKVAFVDGVQRREGLLYRTADDGRLLRGGVGAFSAGATVAEPGERMRWWDETSTRRLVIFGGGQPIRLPDVDDFSWDPIAVESEELDAPQRELQSRMRAEESKLAEKLAADGWLTVLDGPLTFTRSRDLPLAGLVKTHHRMLLAPEFHARVGEIRGGERTPLFQLGSDRYSAYMRLTERHAGTGPWHGIIRLEVPQSAGVEYARETTDRLTAELPRFAGVPHRDPRAPQNLMPVGALETWLRRRMGPSRFAIRAARIAAGRTLTPSGV